MARFLVVHGKFYEDLADQLRTGALAEIIVDEHEYDEVEVPGALEIPQAMAMGFASGRYAGGLALGTVIRGETGHYDIVANESARALMDLAMKTGIPIGNGILTVENEAQAWERAAVNRLNKGGAAARAMLHLALLKNEFAKKAAEK
jgi:6,7-dimethyl-8-ribityllumazine synthase